MKSALRIEGIGKQYRIGSATARYATLRESLLRAAKAPFLRLAGKGRTPHRTIWALRDVSFEVAHGEILGIIGPNGAGKSTLLKILSRITAPTTGRAELSGRIGSLLEVGTGFHPELTGRENVFLSGAILGMSKAELKRKFDGIVDFAEVEQFIDTPVKQYSSGMYVRLAFAVAAHLEPDILLIDEVLAVGDLSFQQKCLRHMRSLRSKGMTILLVSHNMPAIQSSCARVLYFDGGNLVAHGKPGATIEQYRTALRDREKTGIAVAGDLSDGSDVKIKSFQMRASDGESRREFDFGEPVQIRIELHARKRIVFPLINFGIRRSDGITISNYNNWFDGFRIDHLEGDCSLTGWLPPLRLTPNYYEIWVLVWQRGADADSGDPVRMRPLASTNFGDFSIRAPALTTDDAVFHEPAVRWVFRRGDHRVEFRPEGGSEEPVA